MIYSGVRFVWLDRYVKPIVDEFSADLELDKNTGETIRWK